MGIDNNPVNTAGQRLFDVKLFLIIHAIGADNLQIVMMPRCRARDSQQDLKQIGMIKRVADKSNRATMGFECLVGCALGSIEYDSSPALLPLHIVLVCQAIKRFDNGDATDPIVLGQLPFRRQEASRSKLTSFDAIQQRLVDLEVQGQRIVCTDLISRHSSYSDHAIGY